VTRHWPIALHRGFGGSLASLTFLGALGCGGAAANDAQGKLDASGDALATEAATDQQAETSVDSTYEGDAPDALPLGCCNVPSDCGDFVYQPCVAHKCVTPGTPPAGRCWDATQCSGGSRCLGPQVCGCGLTCAAPDVAGTCEPAEAGAEHPEAAAGALDGASRAAAAEAGQCLGTTCSNSYDCRCGDGGGPAHGIACGASATCEACTTNGLNDPCLGRPPSDPQGPDCCPGLRCVNNRCVL
jgi:hypothetical protein